MGPALSFVVYLTLWWIVFLAVLPLGGATGLRTRTGPVSLRLARCRGCFLRRPRCVPGVAQSGLSRCV